MKIVRFVLNLISTISTIVLLAFVPYYAAILFNLEQSGDKPMTWGVGLLILGTGCFIILIGAFIFQAIRVLNSWLLKEIMKHFNIGKNNNDSNR